MCSGCTLKGSVGTNNPLRRVQTSEESAYAISRIRKFTCVYIKIGCAKLSFQLGIYVLISLLIEHHYD